MPICPGCDQEYSPRYEGEKYCQGSSCEQLHIAKIIAKYPKEFGLRGFPGKVFSISQGCSFYSQHSGLQLYTAVKNDDGTWSSFARDTEAALVREMVRLPLA